MRRIANTLTNIVFLVISPFIASIIVAVLGVYSMVLAFHREIVSNANFQSGLLKAMLLGYTGLFGNHKELATFFKREAVSELLNQLKQGVEEAAQEEEDKL